ncbi:unnamed protein product [Adineta ricciae]|uniref:non-specific serine/threonine protein kinase n=1 Tax=Adineta ricciae TaxID=249248 RepID=A0A815N290_ADIRI|nr:unnamed protein product [Adineta ricciae]
MKENSTETSVNVVFGKDEKKALSPYEKLVYEAQNDVRCKEEVKAGRRIGFYRIVKNIGLGNFSKVKLGVHLLAKEKVAIKILDKTKLDKTTQRLLSREITSAEKLHHPNIIRIYEVIETDREIYIITEYAADGDLYTRITDHGKMPENEAKVVFAQIAAAVDHMHSKGIVHRDIKCENVFFGKQRLIKLGDLGFSTYTEKHQMLTTFCGSPPYAAPELYRDESYEGIYVDIWALGVTLYFMVTGLMPFRGENLTRLKNAIVDGNYSIPAYVSKPCKELINGLLSYDKLERWSMEQIRSCTWLTKQYLPKEYDPYTLNLSYDPTPSRESFEYEAQTRLAELGITSDVLKSRKDSSSSEKALSTRDNINGTYRIILHRLQKQSTPLERDDLYEQVLNDESTTPRARSMSVNIENRARKAQQNMNNSFHSHPQRAKVCTIL